MTAAGDEEETMKDGSTHIINPQDGDEAMRSHPGTRRPAPRFLRAAAATLLVAAAAATTGPPPCSAQEDPPAPAADPADVESIDAIVAAFYGALSDAAGDSIVRDRFLSLFAPDATLGWVDTESAGADATLTDAWYATTAEVVADELPGVGLTEINRVTEPFGTFAHVFSTFEETYEGEQYRGILSFQVLRAEARWWIVSAQGYEDDPDNPTIPARFLPTGASSPGSVLP